MTGIFQVVAMKLAGIVHYQYFGNSVNLPIISNG